MNPEPPETESEVIRRSAGILTERLPSGWLVRLTISPDKRIDGLLEVASADGRSAKFVIEAKRVVDGRDVDSIRNQLEQYTQNFPGSRGLVFARYLSPSVRTRLVEVGLSYVDATGNVRVEAPSPGLFVSDRGSDKDPWRGPGRPRGTLKGAPAAKVVRAIADFSGPWTVPTLIDIAKVSSGAAYRVVEFLEREGMATRNSNRQLEVSDWIRLLRRWSDDYGFVRSNKTTRWIAPRGLLDLMKQVAGSELSIPYAVTGTLAAAEWAPSAPARLAMIYSANAAEASDYWGLRPAEAGNNVILAEPVYDVVFERCLANQAGLTLAAPTQVAVDLMTGPGRSPNEAEELLEWMNRNEQSWRL